MCSQIHFFQFTDIPKVTDVCTCVPECGGYLTGPAGSFSYPNTPGHDEYDHQVSCAWVIRTDPNKVRFSLSEQSGRI